MYNPSDDNLLREDLMREQAYRAGQDDLSDCADCQATYEAALGRGVRPIPVYDPGGAIPFSHLEYIRRHGNEQVERMNLVEIGSVVRAMIAAGYARAEPEKW